MSLAIAFVKHPLHPLFTEASLRRSLLLSIWFAMASMLLITACSWQTVRGEANHNETATDWRRTDAGWEHSSLWQANAKLGSSPTSIATVHPLVIASLELLMSIGFLVLATPAVREK